MADTSGFLDYLRTEKRYSPHTVNAYQADIEQFRKFIEQQYELNDLVQVRSQMVRSWVIELMENKVSSRSVNRKLSSLKSLYKFWRSQDKMDHNPMLKVSVPKVKTRLPNYMEQDDMRSLFDEEMFTDDFKGSRNKLLLMLLYYTGMRRSELIGLKSKDVDADQKTIRILGKGNKERIVPINDELLRAINDYKSHLLSENIVAESDHLLVTDAGKTMYPNFVYRLVKDHLAKVSTAEKRSPHVLRHTFATHMLNNGADLNAIKEILGHANLSATQIYTHNSVEQLKQIYNQAHPKA